MHHLVARARGPLGLQPGEFDGSYETFASRVYPDDLPGVDAEITRCMAERERFSHEYRLVWPDGSLRWVQGLGEFSYDADGRAVRMLGGVMDITARKASETALRRSEERMALAQDAAHAGTWEWDFQSGRNYWSDSLWSLYGLLPGQGEPSYDAWTESIHPEDRERVAAAIGAAAAAGEEFEQEWRVRLPPGEPERWLLSRGRPIPGTDGCPERYVGIVIDITETKRTAAALRLWADAFQHCAHGVAIGMPQTNTIRVCNPAFAALLGYAPEEIAGMPIPAVYTPDELPHLMQQIAIADGAGRTRYESRMRRKDGST